MAELEAIRSSQRARGFTVGSDAMFRRLDHWLLDDEQRDALARGPLDLFYLAAAVCLWDVGREGGGPTGRRDPLDTRRVAMDAHDRVIADWALLGIRDRERAQAIAWVLRAAADIDRPDRPPERAVQNSFPLNIPLIAGAIRFSAALDLSAAGLLAGVDDLGADQLDGVYSVEGEGPHPYLPGAARIRIRCRHPEVHRALKHHESAVNRLAHGVNRIVSPRFLFSVVVFDIEPEGYEPIDLKFSVDSSSALQLFTGNRLYSDNRVFLRELIQNAIDACLLRQLGDKDYEPAISVSFNDGVSVIAIRDNGIGMNRQWIEKYFLTIGISLYQSGNSGGHGPAERLGVSFISQFGIGFLSSFLVAEKIVIKTRKEGDSGLMITITHLRDYFDVRPLDRGISPGTEVTLHLKPSRINYCRSLEFVGYLKSHIRFVDFPIRLIQDGREEMIIGGEALDYRKTDSSDEAFVAKLDFPHSEGYLFLKAKSNGGQIYALDASIGGVSVFQDGIFVTQTASLLPEGARGSVVGRINLRGGDKCALSMDRNRIFWTDDKRSFVKKTIRHGIVDLVNQLWSAAEGGNDPERLKHGLKNQLTIFFDFNDVDDAMYHRLCLPIRMTVEKRFRDFVRIHFPHTRRIAGIPEADGYAESWQQRILETISSR
jgi:hypothetical protein